MKKTIIAAAVAASVAAPAAFADVSVYGKIHQATNDWNGDLTINVDNGANIVGATTFGAVTDGTTQEIAATNAGAAAQTATGTADLDGSGMTSNASRIGVKGTEDLGNGMSAFFLMEWAADLTDGTAMGGARDAYVGIDTGNGKISVGRMGGPTKGLAYASLAPRVADSHEGSDVMDLFESKNDRANNVIAYTNKMGAIGLTAAVSSSTEGRAAADNGNHAGVKHLGVSFDAGNGLSLNAATMQNDQAAGKDATILGAKMSFGDLTVGALYEDAKNRGVVVGGGAGFTQAAGINMDTLANAGVTGITGGDAKAYALTAAYKMGNNTLSASYGKKDYSFDLGATGTAAAVVADADQTNYAVNFEHSMSKRTSLYVSYLNADLEASITKNSANAGTDTATLTGDASNISVGIVHSF
jgi:predicted porin